MSLDKSIEGHKEHRKPYRVSKTFDRNCEEVRELKRQTKGSGGIQMNTKEQQWITKAVQLLKQMEFCGTNIDQDNRREQYVDEHVCPICGCSGYHRDSCELQELLKEAEEIK